VEKAFSCGVEAVHIAEQYALTYARWYRKSCTGNRAKGRGELNRTMVIVRSVISVKSITDGTINDIASYALRKVWTEGDQTGYRDADGDHKNISQEQRGYQRGRKGRASGVEWQISTSEARWRSEVVGSG